MSIYKGTTLLAGSSISIPLLTSVWQDHKINDISWLCADTFSWQSGSVYTAVYNHLVSDITNITASTETISGTTITYYQATDGHKIVLADQETNVSTIYILTGVAWYYILDTTNTRFKLPRTKYAFTGLRNTVGKYVEESLPNITGEVISESGYAVGAFYDSGILAGGRYKDNNKDRIVYFDASRSSSTYQNGAPVQQRSTQMYLYFYVGQFTQTATEQTAGLNITLFNGKVDLDGHNATFAHIVETYSNGTDWYRVWSDGWCKQGGTITSSANSRTVVNFLKHFRDTNYAPSLLVSGYINDGYIMGFDTFTTSTMSIWNTMGQNPLCYWQAEGYIS